MEILDRELPVMVFPVYLQRAAVVAVVDCPDRGQFNGSQSLKQAAPQSIWLFQESRLRHGRFCRPVLDRKWRFCLSRLTNKQHCSVSL